MLLNGPAAAYSYGLVKGVVTESKSGRQAILAERVVDATGELVGILDRRMVVHVLAGREGQHIPEEPVFESDFDQPPPAFSRCSRQVQYHRRSPTSIQ